MAPIRQSIEIARSPEDVFAYLNELSRHPEWQKSLVSARGHGRPHQSGHEGHANAPHSRRQANNDP
jgi:hypothetical protein